MAKLAAKKKPNKPDAPKKPSSRSKTGNAECSQAASNWQLSIRGKATLNPGTYQTLAKCRALSKSGQMADAQGRTGKLSAMGEQAVKARLQSRFDSGLITQKSRTEKLNVLLKKRSQAIESGKSAATSEGTVSSIVKRAETPMSEVLMTGHRWKSDGTLQIDRGRYQAAITDEINATLDYAKNGKNSRKSLKEGVGNFPKDHPLHGQAVAYVKGRIDDIPFENLAARTKVKTLESLKTKFAESLAPNTPREQKAAILGNVARSIAKPNPPLAVQAAPKAEAKPAQEAETVQERRESSNTAKLEDKYKLKKPITGPTGEKIVGYQWVNTTEEGMFRDRKVSDWSAAQTSVPTGRSIVHLFWVEGKDGKQTLMGRGAAQKSLGMPESKLVTVAKREADRQKNAILRGKKRSEDAEKYGESSAKMAIGRFITANPNSGRTPQVAFKNGKYVATISDEFKGELKDNGWSLMAPGRGTSARSAKAEFLLKKRSERGKLAPSKPAVQAAPQPAR